MRNYFQDKAVKLCTAIFSNSPPCLKGHITHYSFSFLTENKILLLISLYFYITEQTEGMQYLGKHSIQNMYML